MAPVPTPDNYYAILDIPHTATLEVVRQSYRRLAKALHPDKNPDKLDATASFQTINASWKLGRAYETINDPEKRKEYDVLWIRIWGRQSTQQEAEKRQAAAAETERKRTAEEEKAQRERLQNLELRRSRYDSEIFEANRVARRLAADLKRLQDQDDEDLRKEREMKSWWTYITSPMYGGQLNETEQQRQERDAERLQRCASKTIKEADLAQREARLHILKDALQQVNSKIAAEKKKAEAEAQIQAAKRQHQFWKEQEARRRAEEELEKVRRERQAKEQAARAAKAHEEWQAQERVRKAAAEVRRKAAEAEERAARMAEAARNAQSSYHRASASASATGSASTSNNNRTPKCTHDQFWPKIEGRHLCSNCNCFQKNFAFRCPGCSMVACANCRQTLRGEERTRKGANRARSHHYARRGRFDRDSANAANGGAEFFDNDEYDYHEC